MSGMTEGVPGQGGPVSDAQSVREAELRDAEAFAASLDRVGEVVEELLVMNRELSSLSFSEEWARLLGETPEVASHLVASAVSTGDEMDRATWFLMGARLVAAARRAGPSDNLVASIVDAMADRRGDENLGAGFFEGVVREVLQLAEVI